MQFDQFFWGAILLSICAIVHIVMIVYWTLLIDPLRSKLLPTLSPSVINVILTCMTFFVLLLAHSFQVWLWAAVLYYRQALSSMDDSIYFTLISYTTVGYGDLVLGKGDRILGAMSSVAGMLNFGLSTAYLVALFQHVLWRNSKLMEKVAPWSSHKDEIHHDS